MSSSTPNFSTVLVANRGEIACRVIRSAHALGFRTVAVYSDADADAPHVALADQAVHLGASPAAESYLVVEKILEAAERTGADAIHPGYGFLSENSNFASKCAEVGITFIGPPPSAIAAMGDKAEARQRMAAAAVPCVPGYDGDDQSDERLMAEANAIGFPVLVKAAAGGGGRGMRRVASADALPGALASARREAQKAFGHDGLLLEKLVVDGRHVEVQVMADTHGTVLHLGERDCSTQRRYQKVIEEAPSPAVDAALREKMGDAAVAAARAIGYVGAGTVEFLLGQDGSFYFLEMNTRLQVEHPVTELVTGLDLVELQLRVAAGEPLGLSQEDIWLTGHAIEARLYAEDPTAGYAPQSGDVLVFSPAEGDGVRSDHGLRSGMHISSFYDAMVAKVIAFGAHRDEARRRLDRALRNTTLLGVRHNKRQLLDILSHETFASGQATTGFLEATDGLDGQSRDHTCLLPIGAVLVGAAGATGGFSTSGAMFTPLGLIVDGDEPVVMRLTPAADHWLVSSGESHWRVTQLAQDAHRYRFDVDGRQLTVPAAEGDGQWWVDIDGNTYTLRRALPKGAEPEDDSSDGVVRAPFSGGVVTVSVAVGDTVTRLTETVTIEAMKIESPLQAGVDGTVAEVRVSAGNQVANGQVLVVIDPT